MSEKIRELEEGLMTFEEWTHYYKIIENEELASIVIYKEDIDKFLMMCDNLMKEKYTIASIISNGITYEANIAGSIIEVFDNIERETIYLSVPDLKTLKQFIFK